MPVIEPARNLDSTAAATVHRAAAVVAYASIFPADSRPPTVGQLAESWRVMIGDPTATVLVARLDGRVVGAAAVVVDEDMPTGRLLARLYVDPDHWGIGLGGRLHDQVLDAADIDACNLWVLEQNQVARSMYERRGWILEPGRTYVNQPSGAIDVCYRLG